jgi:hypothetical protein
MAAEDGGRAVRHYAHQPGCDQKPRSAGRDEYALKLASLILAGRRDFEMRAGEWLRHPGQNPRPAVDAEVEIALGVIGRRGDRCQRGHIAGGQGDHESVPGAPCGPLAE